MRIVITGATGLIGRSIVQQLLCSQNEVVALGRDSEKLRMYFSNPVINLQTQYELADLVDIFKDSQIVIHLAGRRIAPAAEGFQPFYEGNIHITENVLEAAGQAGVTCVVQASSLSVYSTANPVPFREIDTPIPVSIYGISKLACEQLGVLSQQKYPMRVISLRIAGVLGYGDHTGEGFMLARFIQLARKQQTLPVFGNGIGARDLIYVQDAANACLKAMAASVPSGIYNIGAGRPYSVRELAEAINHVFENAGNFSYDLTQPEDGRLFFMDCSRAKQELGWEPTWTLSMGLEEMKKAYDTE